MYNSRIGRRTRRISDSKVSPKLRDRRFVDEDDDDDAELGDANLTPEEVQGLLELLPYKEALIKIAKGEFEIEKVEEVDEDEADEGTDEGTDTEADEENFEEDEDFAEGNDEDSDEEDYEDFDEEDEAVEDSAVNDAWRKRLAGNNK